MRARSVLAVFCGALALAACVLKADGFSGGPAPAGDSGLPDSEPAPAAEAGTPEAAAPEAGVDAGDAGDGGATLLPNLLVNGDFEQGCNSWKPPDDNANNVTMTASTDVHSGAGSCRVCINGSNDTYVYQTIPLNLPAGSRIAGEIFVRGAQANPPGSNIQFAIDYNATDGTEYDAPAAQALPSSSTWIRMSMIQDLYNDAKTIGIFVVFDGNQNKCVLLDDAALGVVPNQ